MKVKVVKTCKKEANTKSNETTLKEYTLKPNRQWANQFAIMVNEIHFVHNIPNDIGIIDFEWDPTVEEDGGIKAVVTNQNNIWVEIGNNKIFAHEDSSYMFAYMRDVCVIDGLNLIDTSKVKSFYSAFARCGEFANIFSIAGLETWDVSNVEDMAKMFYNAGRSAKTWNIGRIANWDVRNVTDMYSMFGYAGYMASSFIITSLSHWDVSNVECMNFMFENAGRNAEKWDVGNLSNWDISKCKNNMVEMFAYAAQKANLLSVGDICKFNTQTLN